MITLDSYLKASNLSNPFDIVNNFEQVLAGFFSSKYAVLTDCCTHAIELCLRLYPDKVCLPKHTYMSVPMTAMKLGLPLSFSNIEWTDYYPVTDKIYDAAVLWRQNSYIPGTMMCISFQHKKHINIGKGGCILLDNEQDYHRLKKMRYDGRDLSIPHHDDNVGEVGYHYYMTPEDALRGIEIFNKKSHIASKQWSNKDYIDLTTLKVFKNVKCQ